MRPLLLFMCAASIDARAELIAEVDRFTGLLSVHTPAYASFGEPVVSFSIRQTGAGPQATLSIHRSSNDWRYLHCNDVRFLVDGKPFAPGKFEHSGTVESGYVLEHLTLRIGNAEMYTFTHAKRVECRICRDEFEFTRHELFDANHIVEVFNMGPAAAVPD